jgi:predicted secreted protein
VLFNNGPAPVPFGATHVEAPGKSGQYLNDPACCLTAHYETGVGQALNNSAVTVVNFEQLVLDVHATVTTGSNWHFTAPAAGEYRLSAQVSIDKPATYVSLSVFINGIEAKRVWNATSSYGWSFGINTVLRLNASDTLNLQVYVNQPGISLLPTPLANWCHIERIPGNWSP